MFLACRAHALKAARVVLALVLAAFASGAARAEGAKIGVIMSMTGALQAYGQTSLNGVRLAVDEINAAGGVLGGKLEIVVGDDQTAPQPGVEAAQKLVSVDKVAGIVGALSSGVTIPITRSVTAVAGVPQISNASTSPVITDLDDKDFLFRTVPSDALQGVVLADVARKAGYKALGVIYVNNDYGDGLQKAFMGAFTRLGGKVTASLPYEPKNPSYRGELSRIADGKPEALLVIAYPEDGIPILRQSLEEGFFSKFVFTDGMKAPEVIKTIGEKFLEGSIGTAPEAASDTPSAKRFKDAYNRKFGEVPPKPFIDSAYDAAYILALAIEKAGSADPMKVRDAIREVGRGPGERILPGDWAKAKKLIAERKDIDYSGAAGYQDFDAKGDVPGSFGVWKIEKGLIKTTDIVTPRM